MQLHIDDDAVARARRLAGAIADPIEDFIARHSTVSVERSVARLCGIDGVDADGVPLPNRLVEAIPSRENGVARALGAAVAESGRSPREVAEWVARGERLPDPDRTPDAAV
ncbi:MAG TPA: lysine 5,6-aminomutase subunit alpha, partial [Candidatus Elarobacter sp.]